MSTSGNPQKENGYTAIANELMEALIAYRIPGEQVQCLLFILRKTYGWNKKEDTISIGQVCKATGINRPGVIRALKCLVSKKILYSIKNDIRQPLTYGFNKHYEEWLPSIKKDTTPTPSIKKGTTPSIKNDTKPSIKKDTHKRKGNHLKQIYTTQFQKFYEAYPKHQGKKAALNAWMKNPELSNSLFDTVMNALERQKAILWKDVEKQYIPYPATWLNGCRWEDEVTEETKTKPEGGMRV